MGSKNKIFWIIILISLVFMAACGGSSDEVLTENNSEANSNTQASSTESLSGVENGQTLYNGLCIACHGADAKGVQGLGKDLTASEFVASKTDEELVAFIAEGRPAAHEDNTTGVDMPPRGGNPSLTDQDLADIVAFVRTLTE